MYPEPQEEISVLLRVVYHKLISRVKGPKTLPISKYRKIYVPENFMKLILNVNCDLNNVATLS